MDATGRCTKLADDPKMLDRLFFDSAESHDRYRLSERQARRICAFCPIRQQCLQYAVDHERPDRSSRRLTYQGVLYPNGIWGGVTAAERVAAARYFPDRGQRLRALEVVFHERRREVTVDGE